MSDIASEDASCHEGELMTVSVGTNRWAHWRALRLIIVSLRLTHRFVVEQESASIGQRSTA